MTRRAPWPSPGRTARAVAAVAGVAVCQTALAQVREFGPPYVVAGDFFAPAGLGVDEANGRVFVADTGNHRVKYTNVADLTGVVLWAELGYVADPGATDALTTPQGVAVDAAGNVYAIDTFHGELQLYRFDPAAETYTYDSVFTAGTSGPIDGLAPSFPRDVAAGANGWVYLLDSGNGRVLVADGPDDGSWFVLHESPLWDNPYGLDVADDGTLYVADTGNHVVRVIAPDGTERTMGTYGTGDGAFRAPRDVAVGPDGRIYVADTQNHRVSVLRPDGTFSLHLGVAPLFNAPQKVEVDSRDQVFVIDADAQRLVAFLGASVSPPYDLYVRDNTHDDGVEPLLVTGPGTFFSPDILVRHAPDVDPAEAATLGPEAFLSEIPRAEANNYIYVGIHNRGAQPATSAVVRLYWTDTTGRDFAHAWRTDGFYSSFSDDGSNTPGNSLLVPSVPARLDDRDGAQVVGPIVFRPPPEAVGTMYYLLARVLSPYDPLKPGEGQSAVVNNNAVAARLIGVSDENRWGSFLLDIDGDVYVQLIYARAAYANYVDFSLPVPNPAPTCPGVRLPRCYLDTLKCKRTCPQEQGANDCRCIFNETSYLGSYEAGQRVNALLHVDRNLDGLVDATYSADPLENADGFDHLRTFHVAPGAWILEWEDLPRGGDQDFDDIVLMLRVVPRAVSPVAAPLGVSSLFSLASVVVEDRESNPDPKVRLTMLLQNADTAAPRTIGFCPMLSFSTVAQPAQLYTYEDGPGGTLGDGTPDHVGTAAERVSVRFSRDQRRTNVPPHAPPAPGDLVTVPAASGTGPGELAVEYEIELSTVDAHVSSPEHRLESLTVEEIQARIAGNGLATDVLSDVAVDRFVCPNGPMTAFDGNARQLATTQTAWSDPSTYRIASPAGVRIPTIGSTTRNPAAPPVDAVLEYYWTDNLAEHLRGHISSTLPPRSHFLAGAGAVTEALVTLGFPDDLPEGFQGKLEAFVREPRSGRLIVTTTRTFSKDTLPPSLQTAHTERTPDGLDVAATLFDASGVRDARALVSVNGVARVATYLSRVSPAFSEPAEMTARVGDLAPLDRVQVALVAADRARLSTALLPLPVANLGKTTYECNAVGLSQVVLDGSRSSGALDGTLQYQWDGPFGIATGVISTVEVALGDYPLTLHLNDGRGLTGSHGGTLVVRDTIAPALVLEVASPTCLWPPNHKYVPFRFGENVHAHVHDVCDGDPVVRVTSVVSNEPDDGVGDGHTVNDVLFGADGFCVRAERAGGGCGRTYTVTVEARDLTGNRHEEQLQIVVPHDNRPDERCPLLPGPVFVGDGDPRCSFVASEAPHGRLQSDVDAAAEPGAATAPGCSGGGGTLAAWFTAVVLALRSLRRRLARTALPLCVLAAVEWTAVAEAKGAMAVAPMQEARIAATATTLTDGRVLVVGGGVVGGELASTELFDPSTRTWASGGSMAHARRGHTATLLADGRVLVIGGYYTGLYDQRFYPAAIEVFNPGDDTWGGAGELTTPRGGHRTTLLADGRVLVSGGYNLLPQLGDCEIYDPAALSSTPTAPLRVQRHSHEALRLVNGRVVVLGGASTNFTDRYYTDSVEAWDPATGLWDDGPPLLAERYAFTAVPLGDEVLVAGGSNTSGVLRTSELYTLGGSSPIAPFEQARRFHATVILPDGSVIAAGGSDLGPYGADIILAGVERYDPARRAWGTVASLSEARSSLAAAALAGGRVLVAGGWDGDEALASAELLGIDALVIEPALPSKGCACGQATESGALLPALGAWLLWRRRRAGGRARKISPPPSILRSAAVATTTDLARMPTVARPASARPAASEVP